MRLIFLLSMILLLSACDPFDFGFKDNPAQVLKEAFKAVHAIDTKSFLKLSSLEALCVYGNKKGLKHLKNNLQFDPKQIELEVQFQDSEYFRSPLVVGDPVYWSYYQEKYLIDVFNKETREKVIRILFNCDFGDDGKRDSSKLYLTPRRYNIKQCRIIKIHPYKFKSLPLGKKCSELKVNL